MENLKSKANLYSDNKHQVTKTSFIPSKNSLNRTLQPPNQQMNPNQLSSSSSFEDHLQVLKTQEDERNEQIIGDYSAKWKRPPIPSNIITNEYQTDLVFQQIEIDEYESEDRVPWLKYDSKIANRSNPLPIIQLYGCTENGNSVLCHIHGFLPYFYVPAPSHFNAEMIPEFVSKLSQHVDPQYEAYPIVDVEIVLRKTLYGFYGTDESRFLKITVSLPKYVSKARAVLEHGEISMNGFPMALPPFESNIAYTLRFMIDTGVTGANWVELLSNKWRHRPKDLKIGNAQIEVDVMYQDLISHEPEGEWSKVAPLRILSFDIECAGRKGVFPDAKIDPVIQIASMVTIQGESKPFIRNIFTLKECAHIVGSDIHSYDDERDFLEAWSEFFQIVDPDVVTGYNINNFDWPYLLDRAAALKSDKFAFFGRLLGKRTFAKDTRFSSKAYGTRENKETNLDGRLQLDMLQVIQRDHKLRSYSLNSVCAHFLGEQKEDVHHSIITDLQNGNPETRRRLAIYCLKDAYLPQRLLDKLMVLINYMEMSRVTGVPFNYLLTRGQQIKVISQLFRRARVEKLVVPVIKSEASEDQYEGATVIEPKKAYYKDPIATLDFSSLYPSIMMAHNLCYSTLIQDRSVIESQNLEREKDYFITPSGDAFVKPHIQKGVLPKILEDLIGARKRAKADLKKETDPFKKAVLDGRQLALKISANSVYGFTGATVGKLPCLQVSQSVTAFGREMIELTKKEVETHYTISNGYSHNAEVVYGDTDSVMVKFGTTDLEEAMKLGGEAADLITSKFVRPIKLEFEKVYWPYLLINKKRYAGLYWTKPDKPDKMDTKGIETVRRDNCKLVQTVIETCLKKILMDKDVDGAISYTKEVISDLLQNKVDLSQLVITKALSKTGEEYAGKQAHVELAERMRKRDAGSAPTLGDRVAYVIIKASKGAAAYQKAEDPIYVLENNIPIDSKYYLENQLKKPLLRIFEPILHNAESQLLAGEHTRTIQVAAPTTGGLMKFTVKKMTCLGCKSTLRNQNDAVCSYCKPKINSIYLKHLVTHNELESRYSRLWTQCQRCQGSLHQDVLCTSRDCPIFYMRKKVQKVATDSFAVLRRFGDGFDDWSDWSGMPDAVSQEDDHKEPDLKW